MLKFIAVVTLMGVLISTLIFTILHYIMFGVVLG